MAIIATALLLIPAAAFGQVNTNAAPSRKPTERLKIRTVCEVLGNAHHYANRVVAVVGRLEQSVSLIDHYEFLGQDGCKHPVNTKGHVWPTKVLLAYWEEGMPKPPSDTPEFDRDAVIIGLALVRKATTLGVHKVPQFTTQGNSLVFSRFADSPNDWAIAYGRIISSSKIGKKRCGDDCNGFLGAPVAIILGPEGVHSVNADGSESDGSDH
jgi:hypothetical protein